MKTDIETLGEKSARKKERGNLVTSIITIRRKDVLDEFSSIEMSSMFNLIYFK